GMMEGAGTGIRGVVKEEADGTLGLVTAAPWVIDINTVIREGYVIPRKLYQTGSLYMKPENQLVVGTVQGAFNLYIKVAFYAAVFFSVPFLLYQAWAFVPPGLYQPEIGYAAPVIATA